MSTGSEDIRAAFEESQALDIEHARKRPSMYAGDTADNGLHYLLFKVLENSIDEAAAGFASTIAVSLNADDSVTVEDNGRGISVEKHPQISEQAGREITELEGVMTVLRFASQKNKPYSALG